MQRRRFLQWGLSAPCAALLSAPGARGRSGDPLPPHGAPAVRATLDAYARWGPARMTGRVVCVSGSLPAGGPPGSNRDPLPGGRVAERLRAGLEALLGPDPWRQICQPRDVVALKINGLAAGALSPRPELVRAVAEGLQAAGVAPGNIIIWDRTTHELERSGFARQTTPEAVRVYGTDALRGGGYGGTLESFGSVGSFVSRIVSEYATVLINIGVLKDHDLAGVSAGMKNLYGALHNPNRYHDRHCDPFVGEVTALPSLRSRLRLTIVDAILAQAEGGPAFAASWIWPCDRLLLAVDPVACDRIAWDILEARRAALGLPSLAEAGRPPAWIASAARIGLGRDEGIQRLEI